MPEAPAQDGPAEDRGPDRRAVLRGGAVLGLAAVAGLPLAACGGGSSQIAGDVPAAAPVPAAPAPSRTSVPRSKSQLYRRGEGDVAVTESLPTRSARPVAGPSAEPDAIDATEATGASEAPVPSKADRLSTARRPAAAFQATTDDIPVGGGTVYPTHELVVTQPEPGVYVAFDARCTHQGCLVADCSDGRINCPCHGSRYSLEDGSVLRGPARRALAKRPIEITDGEIRMK